MDIYDLIYYDKYNPNFIDDFKEYLENNNLFTVESFTFINNKYDIQLSLPLLQDEAIELFDASSQSLRNLVDDGNNISNIIIIKKLLNKVISESEYEPKLENYTISFYYDVISKELNFFCNFLLTLTK